MPRPDELRHLIDRCTVSEVKAALFNAADIQQLIYVKPSTPLENVGAACVHGDVASLDRLKKDGEVFIPAPSPDSDRTQVGQASYLLDSDYVRVLLLPPVYLVQAPAHREAMTNAISVYGLKLCRVCRSICGATRDSLHFNPLDNYADGCHEYCLNCWLGNEPSSVSGHYQVLSDLQGDLMRDYEIALSFGYELAIMPVARLEIRRPLSFPGMMCFYPPGVVKLEQLGIIPNKEDTRNIAEHNSFLSGINQDVLERHPLVVFPCWFDWKAFASASHQVHLEFIRSLSEIVDDVCFNLIRYRQCPVEPVHALPGKAGQIDTNHMMSGACLFDYHLREARIVGGDAFTHIVTRGLGLPLDPINESEFPKDGEVGGMVRHILSLYASMIESNSSTAKFVQCANLLEALASLGLEDLKPFKKAKKNIVRYVTDDPTEYNRIMDRLFEMWGKKDADGRITGFRTRIVHLGERLENIIPSLSERQDLFRELKGYISCVINHMIQHSEKSWEEYMMLRKSLGPFGDSSSSATVDDIPF